MLVRIDSKISNRRVVAKVLGAVLKKQYSEEQNSITSAEIFRWPLWPVYLKIHSSFRYQCTRFHAKHRHYYLASCSEPGCLKWNVPLPDEVELSMACSHAVAVLEELYRDIVSGAITMYQLCEMEQQKDKLLKLCKAASGERTKQYLAEHTVTNAIKHHKSEYSKLTNRISLLRTRFVMVTSHMKVERKLPTCCIYLPFYVISMLYL